MKIEKILGMNLQVGDKIELSIDETPAKDLGAIGSTSKYPQMGYFKKIIDKNEKSGWNYQWGVLVYENGQTTIETMIPYIKDLNVLEIKK
jgi:hypothetical protein